MKSSEVGLAKAAARVLRDDADQAPSPNAEARSAAIAAMALVVRQRKQKKRIRFAAIAASIAVAASLIVFVGARGSAVLTTNPRPPPAAVPMVAASFVKGTPMVIRGSEHVTLTDGSPLRSGDHVSVRAGSGSRMTIGFAQGTHVAIDDHAEIDMTSDAPATTFHLASGSVRADVAKLLPGERFVIRTSDAEVEVHGTSFEVTRLDDDDPSSSSCKKTRVRVREGVVAVRSEGKETLVHANEVWPICAPPPTAVTTAEAASGTHAAVVTNVRPSDLAVQNDLFEAAISKKRAGDARGAVTGFEDLLARYPQSVHAQSARAERMKLLRGLDRERARVAATDYLKRYPTGFARHDAEVILSEGQ